MTARSIVSELDVELGGLTFPCLGLHPGDGYFSAFLAAVYSKPKVVKGGQRGNGLRESNGELFSFIFFCFIEFIAV